MDIFTLNQAKAYTSQEITKVVTDIKSIVPNGSQLVFTLLDDSTIAITLNGLSDNNFSTIEKSKLSSLNEIVLSKFTYVNNQLFYNGLPFENEISNPTIKISDEYKLATITHNLNSYPSIRTLYTEYGGGVGGAGDFPAGDTTYKLENKIAYEDKNTITIYIPLEYIGSNPVIEKITDTEYIITYSDSVISVILNIIN